MQLKASQPPSRLGKKQMIVYADPGLVEAVEQKAEREDKSLQEMLAEAANAVMKASGRDPVFKLGHERIIRRRKGRSQTRGGENSPKCRSGKRAIGGYYPSNQVDSVTAFASEIGLGRERMLEVGLLHITGRKRMKKAGLQRDCANV